MANTITGTKSAQYLKKAGAESYVHYQFDTNDSIVYLIDKLDKIEGEGDSSHYAKGTTLHETLCALYTLAGKGGQASTDLTTLRNTVNAHIQNTDNPHNVTKHQVGLGLVVNASMDDAPKANSDNYVKSGGVYTAVKNASDKADQAISIANGQSHAYVFADVTGLMAGTLSNKQSISGYKVGDSIYIIATAVSDFWISAVASTGTASLAEDIRNAKKGDTVVVKWGSSYVSLTAFESKRDLNGYVTTSELNGRLTAYSTTEQIKLKYVPYSGASDDVNLENHTLTVSDGKTINPTQTIIDKGNITLSGSTMIPGVPGVTGQSVVLGLTEINVGGTKFKYPNDNTSGTLATQEYVNGKGYQTAGQVGALINAGTVKLKGDVTGSGKVNDSGITTTLSNTGITAGTYSALTVDTKGRATAGGQQIVFAPTIDDPTLSSLVVGGVAIIDA